MIGGSFVRSRKEGSTYPHLPPGPLFCRFVSFSPLTGPIRGKEHALRPSFRTALNVLGTVDMLDGPFLLPLIVATRSAEISSIAAKELELRL